MAAGSTFNLVAGSEQAGSFEVEYGAEEIIVWAWPGAIVKLFCDGEELGTERPPVPAVPEGQTVSSFLRSILEKKETTDGI